MTTLTSNVVNAHIGLIILHTTLEVDTLSTRLMALVVSTSELFIFDLASSSVTPMMPTLLWVDKVCDNSLNIGCSFFYTRT